MTSAYPWLVYLGHKSAGYGTDTGKGIEQGQDIPMPVDTPITCPFEGDVVGVGYPSGVGGVVTVRGIPGGSETVLTDVYFQHLDCIYVKYRDHVMPGDIIGTSGGSLRGDSSKPPTCGHYADSLHSSGAHIEIGFNYGATGNRGGVGGPWGKLPHPSKSRDPLHWLESVASGHVASINPAQQAAADLFNLQHAQPQNRQAISNAQDLLKTVHILPGEDITAVLVFLDHMAEVTNPVVQAIIDTQNDRPANVFDETFDFFKFFAVESLSMAFAFIFRGVFMVIGFILMYKVISSFIDFEQVQATAFQAARVATLVGA